MSDGETLLIHHILFLGICLWGEFYVESRRLPAILRTVGCMAWRPTYLLITYLDYSLSLD